MASPRIHVRTLNGTSPDAIEMPDVKASDLMGLALFPRADYFERPDDMVPGQKVTIRLDPDDPLFGQAFGYIAPKGQCILDFDPNECWMVPPSPTNYAYAHQGQTTLKDGSVLATATISGAGGHAPDEMGWRGVPKFYSDVATQRLRVRYAEDGFGVYAVGIGVAELTWGQAVTMNASATSGDWRWVDELSAWDFMGTCAVNLPALPLHSKSGTRIARKASATPIGEHCVIVTYDGSAEPDPAFTRLPSLEGIAERFDVGHECSCHTKDVVTAAAEPSQAQRDEWAKSGIAMPDGSYYIRNRDDLHNAIQAYGRSSNKAATKRHIIKRARAINATDMLPEDWRGSTKAASADVALDDMTEEEVDARIAEALAAALEANNAAWETKLSEAVTAATEPLGERLTSVEEISLSVLDGASA